LVPYISYLKKAFIFRHYGQQKTVDQLMVLWACIVRHSVPSGNARAEGLGQLKGRNFHLQAFSLKDKAPNTSKPLSP